MFMIYVVNYVNETEAVKFIDASYRRKRAAPATTIVASNIDGSVRHHLFLAVDYQQL